MAKLNKNYKKLQAGYLFSEIAKRTNAFVEKNPNAEIMKLGIGNTTEALPLSILNGLKLGVEKLGNITTYSGYGDEQGDIRLRKVIAEYYKNYGVTLDPSEIFISDGAKPDTANISSIFDTNSTIAVQDPVYPVYVDSNVIGGKTGTFSKGTYKGIYYMTCNEKNGFVPTPPTSKVDIVYLCSPNNPTGAVATKTQLKKFVDYCLDNQAVLIFDAAYAEYIQDAKLPRSIYEIKGAYQCAIEINSFSKSAGFTGVRLGWTIVPQKLVVEDSNPGDVNRLWNRRQTTMFNGASNIVQEGGIAALSPKGLTQSRKIIKYYMDNARIIKEALVKLGFRVYGADNAPYIWLKTPEGITSWEFFDKLLNEAHVVGTPGSGFGEGGEGYFRLSAFGHRENVKKAVESIRKNLVI